jgi:hypothetical protein
MWSGPTFMIPHYIYFWAILLSICGFAWWRGGREERIAATACVLATVTTVLVIPPIAVRYSQPNLVLLAIDVAMLAAFTGIALTSRRFWPLWVAALQLIMTTSHLMRAIDSDLVPRAYAAASILWSYPILLIILVGTVRTRRKIAEGLV